MSPSGDRLGRKALCLVFGEAADNNFLSDFQHEDGVFCAEPATPSDIQRTRGSLDAEERTAETTVRLPHLPGIRN